MRVPPTPTGLAISADSSASSGNRMAGRGPLGAGGTSPKRGASLGLRPSAWPASNAAAASSAPMMRMPSPAGLGGWVNSSSRSIDPPSQGSDLEQLGLFVLHHAVDLGYVLVGQLLQLLLGSFELI